MPYGLLSLLCLLMRIIERFLRYTGYLNFIIDHVSHVYGCLSSRSCTTTELSINLAPCITAIKYMTVIK